MPIAPRMRRTLLVAGLVHVGAAVLAAPTLAGGELAAPASEPEPPLRPAVASSAIGADLIPGAPAALAAAAAGTPAPVAEPVESATPPPSPPAGASAAAPVETPPRALHQQTATSGDVRTVESTAYCLDGITASGTEVGPGQAAMNGVPLGTRVTILTGPMAGVALVVTDRIGHGSELDVWIDDCAAARAYGRVVIDVVLG